MTLNNLFGLSYLILKIGITVQLTLEQLGFELCRSTYTRFFSYTYTRFFFWYIHTIVLGDLKLVGSAVVEPQI